jgi:hypothetical protein
VGAHPLSLSLYIYIYTYMSLSNDNSLALILQRKSLIRRLKALTVLVKEHQQQQ